MVSVPVAGKDSLMVNFQKNLNCSKENAKTDSFSKYMEKNQKTTQENNENVTTKGKTQIDNSEKKVLKEQKVTSSKPEKSDQDVQPIDALDEASQKVVEAVAKELGISVEEVMNALQNLNLTPMDLLQVNNMGNLLVELNGDGDLLNLLTNEDMFKSLKVLNELVKTTIEELKETFSLTDDEFTQLLKESKNVQNTELPKVVTNPTEGTPNAGLENNIKLTDESNKSLNPTEPKTELPTETKTEQSPVLTKETDSGTSDSAKGKVEVQVDKVGTNKETPFDQSATQDNLAEEESQEETKNPSEQGLYQNVAGKNNTGQTVKVDPQFVNQSPETEQIMKQIMDYMKIQVKADATQMEMQLHPSSLGTIHVQIASKEGVITAQFTAQNESVKAALEGQIVQLKETFNEQGLKVEAVEVTIASHQFERNMNQGKQDAANAEAAKKKSVRKINLDQMDGMEEESLEEADLLTADMMLKNGNTVDYTA